MPRPTAASAGVRAPGSSARCAVLRHHGPRSGPSPHSTRRPHAATERRAFRWAGVRLWRPPANLRDIAGWAPPLPARRHAFEVAPPKPSSSTARGHAAPRRRGAARGRHTGPGDRRGADTHRERPARTAGAVGAHRGVRGRRTRARRPARRCTAGAVERGRHLGRPRLCRSGGGRAAPGSRGRTAASSADGASIAHRGSCLAARTRGGREASDGRVVGSHRRTGVRPGRRTPRGIFFVNAFGHWRFRRWE